jgi:hypothetical protein
MHVSSMGIYDEVRASLTTIAMIMAGQGLVRNFGKDSEPIRRSKIDLLLTAARRLVGDWCW